MAKYPFTKHCEQCATTFDVKSAGDRHQRFCSHACHKSSIKIHTYLSHCARCDKPLGRHQKKYCSQSCAAVVNNSIKPKRIKKVKPIKIRAPKIIKPIRDKSLPKVFNCTCAHCGYKFISYNQRKYCNDHYDLYSLKGKARYVFSINVFKYPDLFDLESLKKIGFRSRENPNGYTRDHKVSVNEALKNNYDPYYIKHVMNCELMLWKDNIKKYSRSSITYEQLVKLVDAYDAQNGSQRPTEDVPILEWFK